MSSTSERTVPRTGAGPDRVVVARVVERTIAEGPGERTAIWVQGCSVRCPGCFNPHLWTLRGGEHVPVHELVAVVVDAGTSGVTFLGGEPFDQAAALQHVAAGVRAAGRSVMTFTGYEYETLLDLSGHRPDVAGLLTHTDLLVDGPYLADQPDPARPWVGSTNQRFHFLSARHPELRPAVETTPDRLEVTVRADGMVEVNGWASSDMLDALLDGVGPRYGGAGTPGGEPVVSPRAPRRPPVGASPRSPRTSP